MVIWLKSRAGYKDIFERENVDTARYDEIAKSYLRVSQRLRIFAEANACISFTCKSITLVTSYLATWSHFLAYGASAPMGYLLPTCRTVMYRM